MEVSEHIDLDSNGFNLIDLSTQNDNLLFIVSPPSHQYHKSPECQGDSTGFGEVGDTDSGIVSQGNDQVEQMPILAQSQNPQRIRGGKCNLRKSLAWDNAFFTSAGVLDPEELTIMMDGECETVQKQFLPGIQEDMERSTDSISSLESDNFTLESLEADLFEDIRASIQKSSKSAKGSFGTKAILQGGDQDISSPTNTNTVSQNQLKEMPVFKKSIGMHKIGVPRCQQKVNTGIQGSTKAVKPEYSRPVVPKSAVRTEELASSLAKPSKGTGKSSLTTPSGTKVSSVGPSRLKTENSNAKIVSVRGSRVSKTISSCGPGRVLPKPASTSQSSSSSREYSMAKAQSTRSSSKSASSESSPEDKVKQSLATVRRKAPAKAVNSPSNCATPQPSSKDALKNKEASKNSALAAYLMSAKVTASTSPASSVSEWSSTSSSSSVVNQKSNKSRSSFGNSSCRSLDGDAVPLNLKTHTDQFPCRQEIKTSTESIKKPSSQTVVVSGSTSMKPTGLRMPSPKIGFFDGVKSVRASRGAMQSQGGLPVTLTKVGSGVGPRGAAISKHKVSKFPPGRIITDRRNETENPDAPFPSQGNPQVTPHIGERGKKMVENNVRVQENLSEEHDEVSLTENLHVTKNEKVFGDNQDFCFKDVKLVDPEHNDSKTESCGPMNTPERLDVLKIDGNQNPASILSSCCKIDEKEYVKLPENGSEEHDASQDAIKLHGDHNPGSSLNSCCKIVEKENVKLQENGSEEHDEVNLTENLHVTRTEMVLGDNQDLCLNGVKLVDPECNDSKTESCRPISTSKRMDGNHEKKMVESNVMVQENVGEEPDEVSLKQNLRVTNNEMVLGDDHDFKGVKLVDPENNDSKGNVKVQH